MLDLKQILDPHGLLNPGKIFPDTVATPVYAAPVQPTTNPFAPASSQEAAAGLAALSAAGQCVQIGSHVNQVSSDGDVWLSTANLSGIQTFAQDDLYVTVGAGTPVHELQTFLQGYGMQAPVAAAWPAMSIGGLIATNFNAPLRMRYGALRDLMLAATVVLADGRTIRAGRSVVKNVAGYDLPKLFVGSHGTLGLLTDVTLKLIPAPRAQRTLCVHLDQLASATAMAQQLLGQTLVASALLIVENMQISGAPAAPYSLVYTAEGVPEDVNAELEQVAAIVGAAGRLAVTETSLTGSAIWTDHLNRGTDGLLVRIGVPSNVLAATAQQLPRLAGQQNLLDFGAGMIYVMLPTVERAAAQAWLAKVRQLVKAQGGYAVVIAAPLALQTTLDLWGHQPEILPIMRALKKRWDPAGILNPGRFIAD